MLKALRNLVAQENAAQNGFDRRTAQALLETQKLQECQQDMRTDINSKFAEMQREAEVALLPAAVSNASPRTDLTV